MREFKIVSLNNKGDLVNTYEMFADMDKAEAWGDAENEKHPGSVVDVVLMDYNQELKYEY